MNPIKKIGIFVYKTTQVYYAKDDPEAPVDFKVMDHEVWDAGYIGLAPTYILLSLRLPYGGQNPLSEIDVTCRLYSITRNSDFKKLRIPIGTEVYVMKAM
jgi:hypothetical protein